MAGGFAEILSCLNEERDEDRREKGEMGKGYKQGRPREREKLIKC